MHISRCDFELSPYNATLAISDANAGVVTRDPLRTKAAIVGAGESKRYAPYNDPEWEVWALNSVPACDRYGRLRVDRWFEMHERHAQSAQDMEWIARCPVPIYLPPRWAQNVFLARGGVVQSNDPDIPMAVRYPIEAVEKMAGAYFACSFAYEIALALLEGFTDIGLFGCELALGTERERTMEWANVSWWIGFAEGRGVGVHLPQDSLLGQHRYRYGIEYNEEKQYVEHYVDMLRQSDRMRRVNTEAKYDSAVDFSQGG